MSGFTSTQNARLVEALGARDRQLRDEIRTVLLESGEVQTRS